MAMKWYVVHTYSGHENKVKVALEKTVKTQGLGEDRDTD
jgi:transcriptional antiterminator NusG